jgi:hypothetical protein
MPGMNFNPRIWIRYWYGAAVLGLVILIYGIVDGDSSMILLGVLLLAITPAMIAFWRNRGQSAPPDSN